MFFGHLVIGNLEVLDSANGLVWFGMVWFDLVWFGMVWKWGGACFGMLYNVVECSGSLQKVSWVVVVVVYLQLQSLLRSRRPPESEIEIELERTWRHLELTWRWSWPEFDNIKNLTKDNLGEEDFVKFSVLFEERNNEKESSDVELSETPDELPRH